MSEHLVLVRDGQTVTTSRLVAEKFGKRHADVLRTLQTLESPADFNERNFALVEYTDPKGEKRPEYVITRDGFAFLVMGFTGKQAAAFKVEFINAFNEAQRQLQTGPAVPQTYLQALRELVATTEEKERLAAQVEVMQPKAEYADKVLSSASEMTTTTIAKELGVSAVTLNVRLHELGVQFKHDGHWVLYSRHQSQGYANLRTHQFFTPRGESRTTHYLVWTEKGRRFIHELLNPKLRTLPIPMGAQAPALQ